MGMRRWIPAFARMTYECRHFSPVLHSRFFPSFLRRQESIPVFASGVTGKKMDPCVREDDAKNIYQLHSVPSTASRLTGR